MNSNNFDKNIPEPIKSHLYKNYQNHPYYKTFRQNEEETAKRVEAKRPDAEIPAAEVSAPVIPAAEAHAAQIHVAEVHTAGVPAPANEVRAAGNHSPAAAAAAPRPVITETITAKYDFTRSDNSKIMEQRTGGIPLTTSLSAPTDSDQSFISSGIRGYQLMQQDVYGTEKMAHFNRERIPERVVHANGSGAHGVFEVTHDLTKYTCAKIYSAVGKKTEMIARFSLVAGEKGAAQSQRDPRGFALKFYTEEGNLDIVGNNTPVFFIREPMKFPDFIHSQKRDPATNWRNPDYVWDFFSLTPESTHQVTILYSSRGIPKDFRHMHGFGTNTFMWYNEKGDHVFVKYHFITNQGIQNLQPEEAAVLAGTDPDSSTRDLYESIQRGDFPSWNVFVQIMTPEQADTYLFDPFDTTKVWFHKDFPLVPLGKFTLNRNPENFFAEIEQLAFCPANMVRGIGPSPDKMLQGRMFGYKDTQRHRLGANFDQIPVNMPKVPPHTKQRDGHMTVNGNFGGQPNYFPSSFINSTTDERFAVPPVKIEGMIKRHRIPVKDVDFIQAGELYRRVMDETERTRLVKNICADLGNAKKFIQYRSCCLFYTADADYGARVARGLGLDLERVKYLSSLTLDQRIKETMP